MLNIYARAARIAAAAVALCGFAVAALLIAGEPPEGDDPVPRSIVVGIAVTAGVVGGLLPALVALFHRSGRPKWWSAAVFILVLAALPATLNNRIAESPSRAIAIAGLIVAFAMTVVTMFALAEAQAAKPGRDRL